MSKRASRDRSAKPEVAPAPEEPDADPAPAVPKKRRGRSAHPSTPATPESMPVAASASEEVSPLPLGPTSHTGAPKSPGTPQRTPTGGAGSAGSDDDSDVDEPSTLRVKISPPCPEPPADINAYPDYVQAAMRRRGDQPIRLYADGIFDLFHYGHARALEQAKKSFPNVYLLVGCCNDELTHRLKGQTVMTDKERYESLRHCKWVDEVVPDAPWVLTEEFLLKHDIDFVCHDALPYADTSGAVASGDIYAHIKELGKFWETQRTEGVSTSELIIRIVRDYDNFVRRNLSRGHTGKEMNVPFVKEQVIRLDMALEANTKKVRKWIGQTTERTKELQKDFLTLFSREGPLRTKLRETRHEVGHWLTEFSRDALM